MRYIFIIFAILLLFPIALSQVALPPASTEFFILPIILSQCDDFTNSKQFLCLHGDASFLTISWTARYFDNAEENLGVTCYLNCKNPGDNIDVNCASSQKCDFVGLVGSRSCIIKDPNYQFTLPPGQNNNVICKFYDPETSLPFVPFPERKFRPINFTLVLSSVTVNVGETFNFPLSVIPLGLIPSIYNFTIAEISETKVLSIEATKGATEKLSYGDPGRFSPRITQLAAKSTNVKVLATADKDPVTCSKNQDCTYLGDAECVQNRCWLKLERSLEAGNASLPDFDVFGFLQIMMISVGVLIFGFKKI